MKKFLSAIMALTMVMVPVGTNTCKAADFNDESSTEFYIMNNYEKSASGSTAEPQSQMNVHMANKRKYKKVKRFKKYGKSGNSINANKKIQSIYGKKKSHKLLYASLAVASVGAAVYGMNKYSANGEIAKTLGTATRNTVDFAKDKSHIASGYISSAKEKTCKYINEETRLNEYAENMREYISKVPYLKESVQAVKDYYNLTRNNWNNNVQSFKDAMKVEAQETVKVEE